MNKRIQSKNDKPRRRVVVLQEKRLEQVAGGVELSPITKKDPDLLGYRPEGPGRDWIWE